MKWHNNRSGTRLACLKANCKEQGDQSLTKVGKVIMVQGSGIESGTMHYQFGMSYEVTKAVSCFIPLATFPN